ncbi:hypothetical protein BH10BAC5_BH10BAC5_28000 [soil metagenome]
MSILESEIVVSDIGTNVQHSLVLYNSLHYYNDVVDQLQKATGFDIIQCEQIAMIAHTKGKAIVKTGEIPFLSKINTVLQEINLLTEII